MQCLQHQCTYIDYKNVPVVQRKLQAASSAGSEYDRNPFKLNPALLQPNPGCKLISQLPQPIIILNPLSSPALWCEVTAGHWKCPL